MANSSTLLRNPLQSPLAGLTTKSTATSRALGDSFDTARRVGTLRASSTPVTINFRSSLDQTNRTTFLRLDLAPGASFASVQQTSTIRGGSIRIISYLQLPGQARQKVLNMKYQPGTYSNANGSSSPVSNTFGGTARIYFEVRNLTAKRVSYQTTATFNP